MRARATRVMLVAALAAGACGRGGRESAPGAAVRPAKGDAIWLADPAGAGEPGLENGLSRIGAAGIFLPAGRIAPEKGRWTLSPVPPPPRPFSSVPVILVLGGGAELLLETGGQPGSIATGVVTALSPALAPSGPYGRVVGVHLDLPFSAASAGTGAALVAAFKRALPAGVFVSVSIPRAPATEEDRKKIEPLAKGADALMGVVFDIDGQVDPAVLDSLRRPWWAAYVASGRGRRSPADAPVAERYFDALSGSPRVSLENDLSLNEATVSVFQITAERAVRLEGLALEPGDRVAFRLPVLPELLHQLGPGLAGKRFVLGRVLVLEGASDGDRLLPLAAFEDVLLGRALAPILDVSARTVGRNAVLVEAANRSPHTSTVSRVSNWVEVDLAPARAADVQIGGFDRYEVYDAAGQRVTPGRATRVRLFETLIAPEETISTARILARGTLPPGCCRYRVHADSAAGPEVTTDWTLPAPTPVPTKAPASRTRRTARAS